MLKVFENLQSEIDAAPVGREPWEPLPEGAVVVGEMSEGLKRFWSLLDMICGEFNDWKNEVAPKIGDARLILIGLVRPTKEQEEILNEGARREKRIALMDELFWQEVEAEYPETRGKAAKGVAPGWRVFWSGPPKEVPLIQPATEVPNPSRGKRRGNR